MTDNDLTLQILKLAGNNGVHSFDLNRQVGTIRAGARVCDLKKKGYSITSIPEKMGDAIGVRYFLNHSPIEKPKPSYILVDPMIDKVIPPKQEAWI
jgi:hypothetical protein